MSKTDELVVSEQSSALVDAISNEYIHAATSDNTRRAYRADIEHFESAGGRLPATDKMIERYLLDSAHRHSPVSSPLECYHSIIEFLRANCLGRILPIPAFDRPRNI